MKQWVRCPTAGGGVRGHHGLSGGADGRTRQGVPDLQRLHQHPEAPGARDQGRQGERLQGPLDMKVDRCPPDGDELTMFVSSVLRWTRSSSSCSSSSRASTCSDSRTTGYTWTGGCSADWRTSTDPLWTSWGPACTATMSSTPSRWDKRTGNSLSHP